jgi:hypothetical protein
MCETPSPDDKLHAYEIKKYDINQRAAERAHDQNAEFVKDVNLAVIKNADSAVKALILINGGAAISVLTFVGALATKDRISTSDLSIIAASLLWFALGLVTTALTACFAYLTNYAAVGSAAAMQKTWEHPFIVSTPTSRRWRYAALVFHAVALACAIGSLVLFVKGMLDVKTAISTIHDPHAQTVNEPVATKVINDPLHGH